MPDGFFELIETHLPPEQPVGPQGGRPLVGHRAVKGVLWWVLATGSRWEDVPREMNCSGCTAHRRVLAWEELDIWDRLHASPLKLLRKAGANAGDHTQPLPVTLDFPRIGGKPGRPKGTPDEMYADAGHDSEGARSLLLWLGIEPHIPKRGREHGSSLGKMRWVVERTIGWIKGLLRMRVCCDLLAVIQEAWSTLAMADICYRSRGQEASGPTNPIVTFRLSADGVGSVRYAPLNSGSAGPELQVDFEPKVAISGFNAGGTNFNVAYEVEYEAATNLQLKVYQEREGSRTLLFSEPGLTGTVGVTHN